MTVTTATATLQRFHSRWLLGSSLLLRRHCQTQPLRFRPPSVTTSSRCWLSSSSPATANAAAAVANHQQICRILFASQTGTAHMFANELQEAIQDEFGGGGGNNDDNNTAGVVSVTVQSCQEAAGPNEDPSQVLLIGREEQKKPPPLNVLLASVTGVGQPPENGRAFYEYIMNNEPKSESSAGYQNIQYSVFGLGNQTAHPKYYNVIAKNLDAQLERLGATRVLPLALGDDGDCIEDDFDQYVQSVLQLLRERQRGANDEQEVEETGEEEDSPAEAFISSDNTETTATASSTMPEQNLVPCPPEITRRKDGMRLASEKYPVLALQPPTSDVVRRDLFHLQGTPQQFYPNSIQKWQVTGNQSLAPNAGETAIQEMKLSLFQMDHGVDTTGGSVQYETGDHLMIYPRNSRVVVEAYLALLDVHPHVTIEGAASSLSYPHPTGITVFETLLHCVDLSAPPSPSFARMLTGRNALDYRSEIAKPQRTVLDLLLERHPTGTSPSSSVTMEGDPEETEALISLEDLLYNLAPMKARYYSIASSSLARPDEILLAFRPIKYVTQRGNLREGTCTSYMANQAAATSGSGNTSLTSSIPAAISSNPTFRLPADPKAPIMLVAGGCGVAPIRAFVEERLAMKKFNPDIKLGSCQLYLGFRSPEDKVYESLMEEAVREGVLSEVEFTYNHGCTDPSQRCMMVSDLLWENGTGVWNHLENDGGSMIICGAGRTFGAAVERELMDLLQQEGKMTWDNAEVYMRNLVEEGRLLEDLAD